MPPISLSRKCSIPPLRFQAPMARRSASASPGVKPAARWRAASPAPGRSARRGCAAAPPATSLLGIAHRLRPFRRLQVRMHHVALDGTGAHDGDLDDEVVVAARLQARQHRHLRARLDLEHTDGVGAATSSRRPPAPPPAAAPRACCVPRKSFTRSNDGAARSTSPAPAHRP